MTTDLEQEARWYAKRVIITPMQTGYQGLYDANTETIYIADDLTPTQYRCVLAHEISQTPRQGRPRRPLHGTTSGYRSRPNAHKPSGIPDRRKHIRRRRNPHGKRDERNALDNPGIQTMAARQRGRVRGRNGLDTVLFHRNSTALPTGIHAYRNDKNPKRKDGGGLSQIKQ